MVKNKEKSKFSSLNFLWAILETFVNILVMITVITLLAKERNGWFLSSMIILFTLWAFRPIYLAFKEFFNNFPKKKSKKKIPQNVVPFFYFSFYLLIFFISITVFLLSVAFLKELVHPLVLAFSLMVSAFGIVLYHQFTKKEFKGPMWSFSKFFIIASLLLFVFVILFSNYVLPKGVNFEPQNMHFKVYTINEALSEEEATNALNESKNLWSNYNISMSYEPIIKKDVNLSSEEIFYLFNKGNVEEECSNYTLILDRILDNSTNLSILFLENKGQNNAGRGFLCNRTFLLVSPEKLWIFDFTGWDTAHEIGHVLGLMDAKYYERTKKNLMNDETKKLLFFNSDFLNQNQVDKIVNRTKNLNEFLQGNESPFTSEEASQEE